MQQAIFHSDRAVLIDWSCAIETEDVFRLVQELGRLRQGVGALLVVILSITPEVPLPDAHVRAALASSLPRILSQCQKFLIALEPVLLHHRLLRGFFLTHSGGAAAAQRVQLCDNRQEAIECARKLAPQEVLGLQHSFLQRAAQPQGTPS